MLKLIKHFAIKTKDWPAGENQEKSKRCLEHSGIRKWLYDMVVAGTPVILKIQKYRHPSLDMYFKTSTFLGDKLFYITLIPIFFWISDPKLGRLFTLLLATAVYIGNFLKELLSLPRPPSPPCWRNKKENDYGLPSTHTMSSLSVTIFLIGYLINNGSIPLNPITLISTLFWIISVAFSRMYLGHHSPADVCAGTTLGSLLAWIWLRFGDRIDSFIMNSNNLPLFLSLLSTSLILIHPRSINTPSYSRSYSIIGVAVGLMYGSNLYQYKGSPDRLVLILESTLQRIFLQLQTSSVWTMLSPQVWKIFVKMITGYFVLNVAYVAMMKTCLFTFRNLFRIPVLSSIVKLLCRWSRIFECPSFQPIDQPETIEYMKQTAGKQKTHPIVKVSHDSPSSLWSKFFSAAGLTYMMTFTVPALFELIDNPILS